MRQLQRGTFRINSAFRKLHTIQEFPKVIVLAAFRY